MKQAIIVIIILVIIVLGWNFLGKGKTLEAPSEPVGEETSSVDTNNDNINAEVDLEVGSEVKEFTVTGKSFSLSPSLLTVKKGDRVKITFKNSDGFHDFRIDEFGVATARINGGQEETVEFVADKVGSFEYYCSVGTHRQMGMKGTLKVE